MAKGISDLLTANKGTKIRGELCKDSTSQFLVWAGSSARVWDLWWLCFQPEPPSKSSSWALTSIIWAAKSTAPPLCTLPFRAQGPAILSKRLPLKLRKSSSPLSSFNEVRNQFLPGQGRQTWQGHEGCEEIGRKQLASTSHSRKQGCIVQSTSLEVWQLSTSLLFKNFKPPTHFDYHLAFLKNVCSNISYSW